MGARVIAVTAYDKSPLGDIADRVVFLSERSKIGWTREEDYLTRQIMGEREPVSSLDGIFEYNCMIFFDGLAVKTMYPLNKTEAELRRRHATID